ncbi:unnamed protein product, partial [Rangifer tarandus platyrhynchus]
LNPNRVTISLNADDLNTQLIDFPGGSNSEESACKAGDPVSMAGSERSSGEKMATHCRTVQQAWVLHLLRCASRVSGSHSRNQIPRRLIFKRVGNGAFSAGSALQEILAERGSSPSGIRNRMKPGSWPQSQRSPPDGWPRSRVLGSEGGGGSQGEALCRGSSHTSEWRASLLRGSWRSRRGGKGVRGARPTLHSTAPS